MGIEKMGRRPAVVLLVSAMVVFTAGVAQLGAQTKTRTEAVPRGAKKKSAASKKAAARFGARAETLLGTAPASKGEWGLLVVDRESGETLYEQNADKFFVPASNMKLFSTALALAKLGPDFRFRTTLETRGAISSEGVLSGAVALTLTPGELAGSPVRAVVSPATPDFAVHNDVVTSAAEAKSDLTLRREPGASLVVVKGTLPAKGAPRKLVLAIEEPAQHAAATLKRLLEERGIK